MDFIIAVDIGTQGTKAILYDTDMAEVCTAFVPSNLISPQPGTIWQEAADLYDSVLAVLRSLAEGSGVSAQRVRCIGIDSQMAGIMGIGEDGEAVTCYDSWLDTRCETYMRQMREKAGKRVTEITGGPVTYTHGPKILWWKHERPDIYEKIKKFVLPHAYVVGKLVGLGAEQAYFDYTCIQYSGFGDNQNLCWSKELTELFDIEEQKLPRIVSPFEVVGALSAEAAEATGLPCGIPLVAGAGDTAASVFGSGMFESGMLLDCAGTASVLCSVVDRFVPDSRYETLTMMRSPVEGYWFPMAYINGGGLCLRWFRDELTGNPPASYEELESKAELLPPGSEGVLFVPHFAGRVLPNNPNVKGSFIGLDWTHTRAHLFRAVMEGIGYEYAYYLSVLKQLYPGERFDRLYAIGGGSRSELFLQIKADILGAEVTSFQTGDTALVGSAVIAGVGCGLFPGYEEPIRRVLREKEKISGEPLRHGQYQTYVQTYLKTIDALSGVYEGDLYRRK